MLWPGRDGRLSRRPRTGGTNGPAICCRSFSGGPVTFVPERTDLGPVRPRATAPILGGRPAASDEEAAMHVLLTEAHFGEGDRLAQRLRELGVWVTLCHDRVGYCQVLRPGGRCPLDDLTDLVDAVVDVRGSDAELTAREYGAVCAVRAGRPVWIVGTDSDVPVAVPAALRDVAHTATEEEFLALCVRRDHAAAAARLGWLGRPAPT
jgi:hypothetical protein